jgi:hypothetical protein
MSYNAIGKVWTAESFEQYLKSVSKPAWCNAICLHHTAVPSLQMRPKGLLMQHIHNMKDGYVQKGWKSGPHLYIDEDQIYAMSPLTEKGVHAVSFNSNSIGIEVLGDYDAEDPFTGRGLQCWQLAAKTTALLLNWLGAKMNESTILFHRDDPKTSKTCPGSKIKKQWFMDLINKTTSACDAVEPAKINNAVQMAAIIDFVVNNKGYAYTEALNMLSRKNNLFFFGTDWIEGAMYDKMRGTTVAPIAELQQIASRKAS